MYSHFNVFDITDALDIMHANPIAKTSLHELAILLCELYIHNLFQAPHLLFYGYYIWQWRLVAFSIDLGVVRFATQFLQYSWLCWRILIMHFMGALFSGGTYLELKIFVSMDIDNVHWEPHITILMLSSSRLFL